MQAEHSLKNGAIGLPRSRKKTFDNNSVKNIPTPEKNLTEPVNSFREIISKTSFVRKLFLKRVLSVSLVICSGMVFCNYFTVGTAVYSDNSLVAFSADESDYYEALSSAKSFAEENALKIEDNFKLIPSFVLRSKTSTSNELKDKLLLTSSSFSTACTLYSGDKKIFTAANETVAKKVVDEYVTAYAMDGEADVKSELTYKNSVIPEKEILSEEECGILLKESNGVVVVSVVNTSVQKEIPFETKQQQDPEMYIGETVTVSEGKAGSTEIQSETVYQNGAELSSKVVSEKVVCKPVAAVVRVGTKPKNVLDSGLFYPLKGVISSNFGARWGRMHEGMDIAVSEGTPVKAAECGTVSFAGVAGGYGNFVKIDHGGGVVTAYAHLSKIEVKEGQQVTADTQIALSGNTGRSTGPHLHFEVVKDGTPLDPNLYLKER